jgi:hypothetical protein
MPILPVSKGNNEDPDRILAAMGKGNPVLVRTLAPCRLSGINPPHD